MGNELFISDLSLPAEPMPDVGAALQSLQKAAAELGRYKAAETKTEMRERIDAKANEAKTNPTEKEKDSGRYKKGRFSMHGLRIAVENPKGSTRSGTGEDGKKWETKMHSHYGYVEGTEGNDTDPVDVFVGDEPHSEYVVAINQVDPKTGKFDEHKIMLGYTSVKAAKKCYLQNYEKGWKGLGSAVPLTMEQFKKWLTDGDHEKPIAAPSSSKKPKVYARVTMSSQHITMLPMAIKRSADRGDKWIYSCCGQEECHGCPQSSMLVKVAAEDNPPTVAVDLDGTLAKHYEEYEADYIPDPRPGARKAMQEFKDRGYRIIIFTVRGDDELVKDWLNEHEIPFDYINENPDQPEDASDKVLADVYIDDRAVPAKQRWSQITTEVGKRIKQSVYLVKSAEGDPQHVLVTGHSGAGKSTLGAQLSEELDMPLHRLDKDPRWRTMLSEVKGPLGTGAEHAQYQDVRRQLMADALALKEPHVIEGTQVAAAPEAADKHRTILVDPTALQVVRRRLGRDRKRGKQGPMPPGSATARERARLARALMATMESELQTLRDNPNVEKRSADDYPAYEVAESDIHGHGSKAQRDLDAGAFVGTLATNVGEDAFDRRKLRLTQLGIFINYGPDRNIELRENNDGGYDAYTTVPVREGGEFTASNGYDQEYVEMDVPYGAVLTNGTVHGEENFLHDQERT
jgi:hypothetical protein